MAVSAEQVIVEPDGGQTVSFFGNRATFKVRGDQTSGAFSITEVVFAPTRTLTPPHVHEQTDEVSFILEGVLGVMVAEEEFEAGPGSLVIRPKGVPHALWNPTDRPVRVLDVATPAGSEGWFEELAGLVTVTPPPSLEQVFQAARRYGATFLPELAPPLVKKHNLRMPGEDPVET
jgi:mannose-6-phosphate isomerase-like protein (cupin superfamily)